MQAVAVWCMWAPVPADTGSLPKVYRVAHNEARNLSCPWQDVRPFPAASSCVLSLLQMGPCASRGPPTDAFTWNPFFKSEDGPPTLEGRVWDIFSSRSSPRTPLHLSCCRLLSVRTTVPGIYGSSSATRSSCLYLPGSEQAVALAPSWRAWLEVGKVGKGAGTRPLLMPACCPQALRAKASSPRSRGPQR